MLIDLYHKISNTAIQKASFCLMFFLIGAPIIATILNALNAPSNIVLYAWSTIPYFVGDVGLLFGMVFLFKVKFQLNLSSKNFVIDFLPLIILLLFGLWCLICDSFATFKFLAFTCFATLHEGFFMYVAYAGIILLGLILSSDRKYVIMLANIFTGASLLLAIVSLLNNGLTEILCVTDYTNTFGYESIFFNTNHYGYYLVFAVLVPAYLLLSTNNKLAKFIYLTIYVVEIVLLILNDTFGSYLAILLTLIFMLVWGLINSDKKLKKFSAILLTLFVLVSIVSMVFTNNVYDNFSTVVLDIRCILSGEEVVGETIEDVGSGRGALWDFYIIVAKQNPVFGVGGQNIYFSPHNIFINLMTSYGLVGLALYLFVLMVGLIRLFRKRKNLNNIQKLSSFIVIAYLISSFFGITAFYVAPYFYFIFGICMSGALKEIDVNELQKVSV